MKYFQNYMTTFLTISEKKFNNRMRENQNFVVTDQLIRPDQLVNTKIVETSI